MHEQGDLVIGYPGGEVVAAAGTEVSIGRDPSCGIIIDHPLVSRHHATAQQIAGIWQLSDAGSRNGLFGPAGSRVSFVALVDATTVRLGDATSGPVISLGVHWREVSEKTSSRPSASTAIGTLTHVHDSLGNDVLIGRSDECGVLLADVLVSRRHARLTTSPDGIFTIEDLDSHNGTFVNGTRTVRADIRIGDIVSIGRHRLVLSERGLEEYQRSGGAAFAAKGLTVTTGDGKTLLRGVEFALKGSSFLGVVGPSGAGKSTLLGALTGLRPAQSGTVEAAGFDLYSDYDLVRHDIGFVPQDDVLHTELTVFEALDYAAQLRFAPDVGRADRRARVDEVIDELGLGTRREVRIDALSGGQRKRVSVALELLTRPSLLILDEPTSGLDPGYERALMQLLRDLADGGRTVIVVTHSVESLHLCDRVLVLAVGGVTAYLGPPQLAPGTLGCDDFQDLFRALSDRPEHDWGAQFAATMAHDEYVTRPLDDHISPVAHDHAGAVHRGPGWFRQVSILVRRHLRVLAADRRSLAMLVASGPLLGVMILISLPDGELGTPPVGQIRLVSQAPIVLLVLTLAATLLGAANAIREIVKELPVFRRERAVGLSISAYVASKVLVLSALTSVQIAVLVPIAVAAQDGPPTASALGSPLLELVAALIATAFAATALGLFVSAVAKTTDQAMTLLPIIIVAQLILTATAVFPGSALKVAGQVSSAQWGFAATASTSELNELNVINRISSQITVIDIRRPGDVFEAISDGDRGEPRWNHDASTWFGNIIVILMMGMAMVVATGVALRRNDPL